MTDGARRRWPWLMAAAFSAVFLATWIVLLSSLPVMPEAVAALDVVEALARGR